MDWETPGRLGTHNSRCGYKSVSKITATVATKGKKTHHRGVRVLLTGYGSSWTMGKKKEERLGQTCEHCLWLCHSLFASWLPWDKQPLLPWSHTSPKVHSNGPNEWDWKPKTTFLSYYLKILERTTAKSKSFSVASYYLPIFFKYYLKTFLQLSFPKVVLTRKWHAY